MKAKAVLGECGLVVDVDNGHTLRVEHPKFMKALEARFRLDVHRPREARRFLQDLTAWLDSSEEALVASLLPLLVEPEDDPAARRHVKESLVRLLVQVEDLQAPLFAHLLEKAVEAALEEEEGQGGRRREVKGSALPLSRLILSQVRWLNKIHRPDEMTAKMEEMLRASPRGFAHDLVGAVPDVVHESSHPRMARVLRDLFRSDVDLTPIALDTFACLTVGDDVVAEIRDSILQKLPSTASEDLPAMFKFLLDSCPEGGELEMAGDLRRLLDFSQSQLMSQATQKKRRLRKESKDVDVMIVHLLDESVSCDKRMANAWFKSLEEVKSAKDFRAFDFLVMLVLHNLPSKQKQIVGLIRNKVRKGIFSESSLREAFAAHSGVIKNFMPDLLSLIGNLGQSSESVLSQFSLFLRREGFLHLEKFCKQDIFADLVGKIGFGGPGRTSALQALSYLTTNYTDETAKFGSFVEAILEYVNCLELGEVKQAVDCLSLLAYSDKIRDPGSTLQTNLLMVLQKQVFSKNAKLVKMGIAGTVVTVKNMTSQRSPDETLTSLPATQAEGSSTAGGASFVTGSNVLNAKNLLKRVMMKTEASGNSGLFMDELADVIESNGLDSRLQKYIVNKMTADFQRDFCPDLSEDGSLGPDVRPDELVVPVSLQFSAMTDGDPDYALAVATYTASKRAKFGSEKVAALLPEFRLLKNSVKAMEDDLDEVLGLVDCPLILPAEENIQKFEVLSNSEKSVVCTSLFYCANWFRELLNAFADTNDTEIKAKVLVRLKDLLRVNADLRNCLSEHCGYVPAPVNHMIDLSYWSPPGLKKSGEKSFGKGKKRKIADVDAGEGVSQAATMHTQLGSKNSVNSDSASSKDTGLLDAYLPFFREMDMAAFAIINYDTLTISSEPSEEEERRDPKLRPPELLFLLSDLQRKLEHILVSLHVSKGFGGLSRSSGRAAAATFSRLNRMSPGEVAARFVGWLPNLVDNLQTVVDYHRRLVEMNNGVADAPGMFNAQTGSICQCHERIYLCLHVLFSWCGLDSEDNRALLKQALLVAAKRKNGKLTQKSPVQELARATFAYFLQQAAGVIHIGGACAHVQLLTCLLRFVDDEHLDSLSAQLAQVCKDYLAREWRNDEGEKERGARYNKAVETLLTSLMHQSGEDVVDVISEYVLGGEQVDEADDSDCAGELEKVGRRKGASAKYPTLSRQTASLHFRIFLQYLSGQVKDTEISGLDFWTKPIEVLGDLVGLMKKESFFSTRAFLGPLLKYSRVFLDSFLRSGMPILDRNFKTRRQECIALLTHMQKSTRTLQHVCSHSKMAKDPTTAKFVPAMKKSLETLVYRVKNMLALNNAVNIFMLGVLKNRDLRGQEIEDASTASSGETEEGEGEDGEDEEPEEDGDEVEDGQSGDEEEEEEDEQSAMDEDEEGGSVCV